MGLVNKLRSAVGGSEESADEDQYDDVSHECVSCGERYFANPDTEIDKCRACGGIKVEPVE